ncbi:MAG TPA: glycosyltransferase [Candidatus Limnocylindrales bacterium]|nr:glycosyltransferase [Candidatus Limnocylindrales bacterium]
MRDQAEALAAGFDIGVVAPQVWYPRSFPRGAAKWGELASDGRDIVPTLRPLAPASRWSPRLSDYLYEEAIARAIDRLWPSQHPDLIHAHVVLPAGLGAVRIGRRLGVPVVLTEHSSPLSMHLKTPGARRRVAEVLNRADRVLAVGEPVRREILEIVNRPVDVVGNLVPHVFFESELTARGDRQLLRLLSVGHLTRQKRFDVLLDAVAAALSFGLDLQVVIIGEGPERASLSSQSARLGLREHVRFEPMTDRDGLVRWLDWCDALVSSSDHESFGLTIAEALASGRPVLTTASGGPELFMRDELGITVPRGEPEALARAIQRLPEFLGAFRPDVARTSVKARFGTFSFVSKMRDVYNSLVKERASKVGEPYDPVSYWDRLHRIGGLAAVANPTVPESLNQWFYRNWSRNVRRFVQRNGVSPTSIYDVGAGTGFWVSWWRATGVHNVAGCDLVPTAVERLNLKYGPRFAALDIADEAIPGTYDLVEAMNVLLHIIEPQRFENALSNLAAAVAPGGHLLLLEPITTRSAAFVGTADPHANSLARPAALYLGPLLNSGLRLVAIEAGTVVGSDPIESGRRSDLLWRWAWSMVNRVSARFPPLVPLLGGAIYLIDPVLVRFGFAPSEKLVLLKRPADG